VWRVLGWAVLVWGCALPLMVAMWPQGDLPGRLAEFIGVAAWTAIAAAIGERARKLPEWSRRGRDLRNGAVALLVLQALLAPVLGQLGFFLAYFPAAWVVTKLPFMRGNGSLFYPYFLLTLACGGQAYLLARGLGAVVSRLLDIRKRRASE
jgi:hypothetical protein